MYKSLGRVLLLILLVALGPELRAASCLAVFPSAVQSNAANGLVTLKYHSGTASGGSVIQTVNLTDNSSWSACSGSSCTKSGVPAASSSPTFVTASSVNGNIKVNNNDSLVVSAGAYGTVTVGQDARLTINAHGGTTTTSGFSTSLRAELRLQPGDYWIDGNLSLADSTVIRRLAASGTVRLFVKGNVVMGNQVTSQNFNPRNLLIYATGSITLGTDANIQGFFYATGNFSLGDRGRITGAISGAQVTLETDSLVTYAANEVTGGSFKPFCDLSTQCTTGFVGGISANYYNNMTLSKSPVANSKDISIDFDWGTAPTGISGISYDYYSIRWDGQLRAPETGSYQFQTVSDDGVRLWVNNQLLIDNWTNHYPTTNTSAGINLVAGQSYTIRLEYYEFENTAVIKLLWKLPSYGTFVTIGTESVANPDTSSYCAVTTTCNGGLVGGALGNYFNNSNLSGAPAASRLDQRIDFDWGTGNPGVGGLGNDNFSARWTASVKVTTSGSYSFETLSDDGVRLWLDNQLLIDNWTDHAATSNTSANINLVAGTYYTLKLEYYESSAEAVIGLRWKKPGETNYGPVQTCPAELSYYGISHSGSGITCAAEPITITAYDAQGAVVNPPASTVIQLSTSPTTGTWTNGSNYAFDGTQSSVVKYLRQTTAATLNINVSDGVRTESSALDPSIQFSDAGLKFYGNTSLAAMPSQVAGVRDSAPVLRAIKTNTDTGACSAQITGSRSVNLAFSCLNPTTCVAGQSLLINGATIAANDSGASLSYQPVTLTFDATGTASIPVEYSDVGQVQLAAKVDLPAQGNDPAITLSGQSNSFVVRPYKVAVTAVQRQNGTTNPAKTSESGAANGFVAAEEPFKVTVQVQNAKGLATPNFGREQLSENDLELVARTLLYPAGGTLGSLSGSAAGSFAGTGTGGNFSNANVRWNNVGSLSARGRLADGSYLGVAVPLEEDTGAIGRFYPDHFSLTSGSLTSSCSSFTYMGAPALLTSWELQAQGAANGRASNYGPGYGGAATVSYEAEDNDGANGAQLSSRFSESAAKSWIAGSMVVSGSAASFNRLSAPQQPDGPYTRLQMGLRLTDNFDARSLSGANMNAATTGACGTGCTSVALGTPQNLRFGQLRLDDAFGPETVDLPVNFITEYWAGNFFVKNTNDSCTSLLRSAINYPAGNILAPANLTVALTGGSTQGAYANLSATQVGFTQGDAGQFFRAPGTGTGLFNVRIDLTAYPWLRSDWNQNGDYGDDTFLPDAHFGFGQYRGHDRIIYWREKLE